MTFYRTQRHAKLLGNFLVTQVLKKRQTDDLALDFTEFTERMVDQTAKLCCGQQVLRIVPLQALQVGKCFDIVGGLRRFAPGTSSHASGLPRSAE